MDGVELDFEQVQLKNLSNNNVVYFIGTYIIYMYECNTHHAYSININHITITHEFVCVCVRTKTINHKQHVEL